jgi:hypothetical protein
MLRKTLSLLALLVAVTTNAWAQSSTSTSNSIVLVITPFLSCSATRGMDFGTARKIDGPLFSSSTNYLRWDCSTDQGNSLNFTFTLPATMINPAATGLPVNLSYGSSSAFVDANGVRFNPSSGLANDIVANPGGAVVVTLGQPSASPVASDLIRADLSTARAGNYSATVVLNVTVNP